MNLIDFYEDISDAIEAFSEESDRGTVLISASLIEDVNDIKIISGNEKNVKRIIELVGPQNMYERICAFIYACLKDKEQNVIRLNLDSEDSIL